MRLNFENANLEEIAAHFQKVFGRNNAVFVPSLSERISRVARMARRFHVAHRKAENIALLKRRTGHLLSWFFALCNHFPTINIAEEMSRKFPKSGCAYCGRQICTGCTPSQRNEHDTPPPDPEQLGWTLGDWQAALSKVYGEANRVLGIAEVFNRLRDEIDEIQEIHDGIVHVGSTAREITEAYGSELADVLAWILGAASQLEIATTESLQQYADGCPGCRCYPCEKCTAYFIESGVIVSRLTVGTRFRHEQ